MTAMTIDVLTRPHVARTFDRLAKAITFEMGVDWPRIALPKHQLHGELEMELKILRILKTRLRAAIRDGDQATINCVARCRVEQSVAVYVARERWKNPNRYLKAIWQH